MSRPRHVFVGGLHGSGTSLVHRLLRAHPQVSGFVGTGAWQDEGQHLQDLLPTARALGGPGRFGWHGDAHLTEESSLAGSGCQERLLRCWEPRWDLDRSVLVEKSPPNLLRFRLLQALFPGAACVAVVRHPLAVALSTRHMRRLFRLRSAEALVRHWIRCHELFEADGPHLDRLHVIRYERFVEDPATGLERLQRFLDLEPEPPVEEVRRGANQRWERLWRSWRYPPLLCRGVLRMEARATRFGYSLTAFGRQCR